VRDLLGNPLDEDPVTEVAELHFVHDGGTEDRATLDTHLGGP
jgi:hypothetical protein